MCANHFGVDDNGHPDQGKAEGRADLTDLERIGHPTRLDHDVVEVFGTFPQPGDNSRQPVGQRATRTPVGQCDGLTIGRLDEVGVNVDIAEIVDQGGDTHTVAIAQQMVQQGGLAGTEITSDDRQWHAHAGSFR